MTKRNIWLLIISLTTTVALMVGGLGMTAWHFLGPTLKPLFAVAEQIQRTYPGSGPSLSIESQNGSKVFEVTVTSGSTAEPEMAQRIAAIVRSNCDLSGFSEIQVKVKHPMGGALLGAAVFRTFKFPVIASKTAG